MDLGFPAKVIKEVGPVRLHEGLGTARHLWCVTNDVTQDCGVYDYRPRAEIEFARESMPYEPAEAV
jgi:hypothetical protein